MACANSTTSTAAKHTSAFSLVLFRKLIYLYRFVGNPSTCHCHSHVFPGICRPHFSHRWVDWWQVIDWHWSNIEYCSMHIQCQSIWPLPKGGQMDNQSPLGDLFPKPSYFTANVLLPNFCKLQWQVPFCFLLEKVQSHCCSRDQPNSVCL